MSRDTYEQPGDSFDATVATAPPEHTSGWFQAGDAGTRATNRKIEFFLNPSSKTSATLRSSFSLLPLQSHVSPATGILPALLSANFPSRLALGDGQQSCCGKSSGQRWVPQPGRGRSRFTSAVAVRRPSIPPWSSHLPPQTRQCFHSKLCSVYLARSLGFRACLFPMRTAFLVAIKCPKDTCKRKTTLCQSGS